VVTKGLSDQAALLARKEAWADAYRHTRTASRSSWSQVISPGERVTNNCPFRVDIRRVGLGWRSYSLPVGIAREAAMRGEASNAQGVARGGMTLSQAGDEDAAVEQYSTASGMFGGRRECLWPSRGS